MTEATEQHNAGSAPVPTASPAAAPLAAIPADHPDRAILEANADLQRMLQDLRVNYYAKGIDSPRELENASDVPAQLLISLKASTVAGLATRVQWLAMNMTLPEAAEHYAQQAADVDVDFDDRIRAALFRDILDGAAA